MEPLGWKRDGLVIRRSRGRELSTYLAIGHGRTELQVDMWLGGSEKDGGSRRSEIRTADLLMSRKRSVHARSTRPAARTLEQAQILVWKAEKPRIRTLGGEMLPGEEQRRDRSCDSARRVALKSCGSRPRKADLVRKNRCQHGTGRWSPGGKLPRSLAHLLVDGGLLRNSRGTSTGRDYGGRHKVVAADASSGRRNGTGHDL